MIVQIRDDEVLDEDNSSNRKEGIHSELLVGKISGISGLIQCLGRKQEKSKMAPVNLGDWVHGYITK